MTAKGHPVLLRNSVAFEAPRSLNCEVLADIMAFRMFSVVALFSLRGTKSEEKEFV